MKLLKKTIMTQFLILLIFNLFIPVSFAAEKANSIYELQTKVKSAMQERKTTYSITYNGNYYAKKSAISKVLENILSSDDYLCYSTNSYKCVFTTDGYVTTIKYSFSYNESLAQLKYVDKRISEILKTIIFKDMNDFQKEKAIHDWIVKNVSYDQTLSKHSAYSGLAYPYKTVCSGYSLITYKMLKAVGIKSKILEGKAGNQDHNWNMVYIEGFWYHLDTCWDDPVPDVKGRVVYNYFNITDEQINEDHSWTKSYPKAETDFFNILKYKKAKYPVKAELFQKLIEGTDLQYLLPEYTVNGPVELNERINKEIAGNTKKVKVRYIPENSVEIDMKAAFNGIYNVSFIYTYSSYLRGEDGDLLLEITMNKGY